MSVQRVIDEINQKNNEFKKRENDSCIELVSKLNYARENPQNYDRQIISSINSPDGNFASTKSYSTTCSEFYNFVKKTEDTKINFKTTRKYVCYIKTSVLYEYKILYTLF